MDQQRSSTYSRARATAIVLTLMVPASAAAADIWVPAGGDLQAALDSARPGDRVLLTAGATYVGNFTLPVHGGSTYVTLRTGGNDSVLPGAGVRITPAHAKYLAKLRSPNALPALATAASAAYWRIMFLEFLANDNGAGDQLQLGSGSPTQNALSLVPQHLIVDRVYLHGDRLLGQKRGINVNSGNTTVMNCHIEEIKYVGQDSQAIAGSNGPGPFHIENNYLEAAGNVFIYGGADPKIPGLVPANLVFTGNTLTRPVSWRDPIITTPTGVAATPGNGGGLTAGTYAYRVVARRPSGGSPPTTATSARSGEVTATVGANGSVTIRWNPVANAAEYRVYGRTPGGQSMFWTVTTTSFTDTGGSGETGTPPSAGTVWQVKNLFELKNMRTARIDYNLMENNWLQAQSGIAILFTVRNQDGACTQCVVEDVTFEYNIVRNMGGGFTILGEDYNHPSQQTNNIRIRHNEFSGLDSGVWGGNGYFMKISEGPRDLVVDHNTIISPKGSGIVSVSGPAVPGFVFTNNVARHNAYGIAGTGSGYGNSAIATYFPNAVIRRNVLAGGKASLYPADNFFPTTSSFETHFTNYAGGDYTLVAGTAWIAAGTDGRDLGADQTELSVVRDGASLPLRVLTQTLPPTTELEAYSAVLDAAGGQTPYRWSVVSGKLPAGIVLDSQKGTLSGSASTAGDYAFTVRATDAAGATASQPLSIHVDAPLAPVQIVTSALASGIVSKPYSQRLEATGGSGAYSWSLTGGTLPPGITFSIQGDLAGTPTAAGTWTFTVTARDAQDSTRQASRTFNLAVSSSQQNAPPTISLRASRSGVIPAGAPVTVTADAADSDGTVSRVDFFIDGKSAGSDSVAPFTLSWTAASGGPFAFTATAVDDAGASTKSATLTLKTTAEIVVYADEVYKIVGDYQLVADTTAAAGRRLWNPNRGAAKQSAPSASPASYVEFRFYAEAGRSYRIWVRGSGEGNLWSNDSAFLQFSETVDAAGVAVYRIGTTDYTWYSVEEAVSAGLAKWGWQDNGFGLNVTGKPLMFERTGLQTIRIQPREDGLSIDQIVISPSKYLSAAPGLPKNDATIVAKP